jgi:hypothetical protein
VTSGSRPPEIPPGVIFLNLLTGLIGLATGLVVLHQKGCF